MTVRTVDSNRCGNQELRPGPRLESAERAVPSGRRALATLAPVRGSTPGALVIAASIPN